MRLPKSVPESQVYLTWAFPALLAYIVVLLPDAPTEGRLGLAISILIVFTGWSSFALVDEGLYNDLLLVVDLGLLAQYFALANYMGRLDANDLSSKDVGAWAVSASVLCLYAAWDFAALLATNTRAVASALHLKRFGYICIALSAPFAVGGVVVSHWADGPPSHDRTLLSQLALLVLWTGILVWWHWGRVRAAIADGREDEA